MNAVISKRFAKRQQCSGVALRKVRKTTGWIYGLGPRQHDTLNGFSLPPDGLARRVGRRWVEQLARLDFRECGRAAFVAIDRRPRCRLADAAIAIAIATDASISYALNRR